MQQESSIQYGHLKILVPPVLHYGISELKTAVSSLNDQELARLAARAERAQADFAAGRLADRDLLIILVGIAALILIIIAVR